MRAFPLLLLLLLFSTREITAQDIVRQLSALTRIEKIESLKAGSGYDAKYQIYYRQPVNHKDTLQGFFKQRIFVLHRSFDRPTLVVTEGYDANYAANPHYLEELSSLFQTNVIVIEHRFFGHSFPQKIDWKYMTDFQQTADIHDIIASFRHLYPNKWISTGISKGGTTCMEHKALYPDDVDVSVPYVGPLNKGVVDGRHEVFLRQIGTSEDRGKIAEFQKELFKRKTRMLPLFEQYCQERHLRFKRPLTDIYDLCVLEYSYAHWQWGKHISSIPSLEEIDKTLFNELVNISEPNYFSEGTLESFWYQAATELGYYGYDAKPFDQYVSKKLTHDYLHMAILPESMRRLRFHKKMYRKVRHFLKNKDPRMIFIYGELDPWTASGITWLKPKQNLKIYIQPKGSHLARIGNMPNDTKMEIIQILSHWLEEGEKELKR